MNYCYPVNPGHRDFKLRPGFIWAEPIERLNVTNPHLQRSIENLKSNIDRIVALEGMPTVFTMWTMISQKAIADARVKLSVSGIILSPKEQREYITIQANKEIERIKNIFPKQTDLVPNDEFVLLTDSAYMEVQNIGGSIDHAGLGLDALFEAQITGFWTAFEVFAADLWEESLNSHPNELAELRGRSSEKSFPTMFFQQFGYDLSNKMGTAWRQKMNFLKLDGIKEAYKIAFYKKNTDIMHSLENDNLYLLNKLRNLIIHSASKYYREYINGVKSVSHAPKGEIGENLALNSEIVHQILGGSSNAVAKLCYSVSYWIESY